MGRKNPPESAVFPGTPTTMEPIPASVVGSPPPTSPPFGWLSAGGFGIPRLRLGYTTATISEGFLECGDPLNHPFVDGFSTINRPAIGGAPWLWKPLHDHDSDGFSWTSMDVNGFGISSHILGCLVGRFLFSDVLWEDLRGIATSLELFWWIWVGRVDIA